MTTLISFYTKDWKYPQHAKRLAAECERANLPYSIEELPSTGSYLKNTCMKPQFISDKLNELKSPVLWVDVDASIFRYPEWIYRMDEDFAARPTAEHRERTWHVGTMWFNYKPITLTFLQAWINNTGNLSDESALEKTWQEYGHMLSISELPPEYFYIQQNGKQPPQGTVIMHRISNSEMKKREMPIARRKREAGEW